MRRTCLTCGHELVPYAHWGICPRCESDFLRRVTPPSIAEQVAAKVGGLLTDKGRPTIGGERK